MKFSIRDLLWLTVAIALGLGWCLTWLATPRKDSQVSGFVSVAGLPLVEGHVYFHSSDGQIVGARIAKGQYSIPRIPEGNWIVTAEGAGVPAKYANENSGLRVNIAGPANEMDFVLQ
jgi:hypothetical protein